MLDKEGLYTLCNACQNIMGAVKELMKRPGMKGLIKKIMISACITYGLGGNETCTLTIDAHLPRFYHVGRVGNLSAGEICQRFDFCEIPEEFDKFPVPPRYPMRPYKHDGEVLRGIHLTDVHIDPLYKIGSEADCQESMCCRTGTGNASIYGEARCDLPPEFYHNFFLNDFLRKHQSLKYIFLTGSAQS